MLSGCFDDWGGFVLNFFKTQHSRQGVISKCLPHVCLFFSAARRSPATAMRGGRTHGPLGTVPTGMPPFPLPLAFPWPRTILLSPPLSANPPVGPWRRPNCLPRTPRLPVWGIRGRLRLHLLADQWLRVLITVQFSLVKQSPRDANRSAPIFFCRLPGNRFGTSRVF